MTRDQTAVRFGRISLIIAAFAMVGAIVGQPLWEKFWPAPIEVTDSGQSRIQ